MLTYFINFIKPLGKLQCAHRERQYRVYPLYHDTEITILS